MKVLIVYAPKGGTSKEAATMLAERLKTRAEVSLFDINDAPPAPNSFDVAVIGGSIRMGKLNKKLKKYIRTGIDTLSSMPTAVFICCGLLKDFEDYKIMQLPKRLECSLGVHCFGGHLKPDRVKGIDKIFVKIMRESILTQDPDKSEDARYDLPELMPDTIYALAERICRLN